MRQKMKNHLDKSTAEAIDIKQGEGGLVDIEFLAQYLVLLNANEYPSLSLYSDNINIFNELSKLSLITEEEKDALIHAYCHLRDFGHKATLQGMDALLTSSDFSETTQHISLITNKYLL
ncbi:hypothetical protein ACPUVO_19415 [Pseudocolwellia sp. HL-MZ19]